MTLPSTIGNKTYNYEFSAKVDEEDEKDLSKYSTSGNIVTLQKDVTIESSSTTATEIQHRIDAYIYNLPVDQTKLFDKQFRAHITIDNLNCSMEGGSSSSATSLAKYWNDNFGRANYTHPNTPSTTYGSLAELQAGYSNFANRPYYIKTTEEKHEACLYYNNKEFCLSKGYWETNKETTKGKLQNGIAAALGVEENSLSCEAYSNGATCNVGAFYCNADSTGYVACGANGIANCYVDGDGSATCYR